MKWKPVATATQQALWTARHDNASKSRDPITITGRATDSGGLEEGVLSTKVMDTNFGHHLLDGGQKLQKL